MNRDATAKLIREHEDRRNKVYHDSKGILTVGIGFNLERKDAQQCIAALGLDYDAVCDGSCELTDEHVDRLFDPDLSTAIADAASSVSTFFLLPEEVQMALVDMAFNLGKTRFNKFARMIAALEKDPPDYCTAAHEMRHSKWATLDVPNRAAHDIALVAQYCKP